MNFVLKSMFSKELFTFPLLKYDKKYPNTRIKLPDLTNVLT